MATARISENKNSRENNLDREEGEILDDDLDDFEYISDNSITLPTSGKCEPSKDHLPVISLSSVSDNEEFTESHHRRKHKRRKKMKFLKKMKFHHHHHHHHKRKGFVSDSDSRQYEELDRRLLKAAVQVDVDDQERFKNSLETRLRAMTNFNEPPSEDKQEENHKSSNQKEGSSDEAEDELITLRLEALRTAILNKSIHRKKRKMKEMQQSEDFLIISGKTDNKENAETQDPNVTNNAKKPCLENPAEGKLDAQDNTPFEDDEDVLRALLLASMSKKIRTMEPVVKTEEIRPKIINNKGNVGNQKLHVVNNVTNNAHATNRLVKGQPLQHTKVKPIIITLNSDSESDDDPAGKPLRETPKKINAAIEHTVEKFLKEQRAKVEAEHAKPKQASMNKSDVFNKSSVKLLSKSKQIEYQNLLIKLKNAQKPKMPNKRLANKTNNSEVKTIVNNPKKFIRTKPPNTSNNNKIVAVSNIPDLKNEARALQRVIKEMQEQKNGRLQMQAKYTVLTPILKKINEASTDRKRYDKEVKRLLQELSEAKQKLKDSHVHFKVQVNEFILKKEEIDKQKSVGKPNMKKVKPFTSTPMKRKTSLNSFDASSIPITSNNVVPIAPDMVEVNSRDINDIGNDKDIGKDLNNIEQSFNPGDPNDIDKIYGKDVSTVPKYISPLDSSHRENVEDPFLIMCPYDIGGNCRDPECIYKHYRT